MSMTIDLAASPATGLSTPWLLRRVNQRFGAEVAHQLMRSGLGDLPRPGYFALAALDDGVHEPGELASRMGVSKQAISKLVEQLVAAGLVAREPNRTDRRRTDLQLTEEGRRAAAVIRGAELAVEASLSEELGSAQFTAFVTLLERLAGGGTS
jgi:DNA-binding MarR family transcriptional regulator